MDKIIGVFKYCVRYFCKSYAVSKWTKHLQGGSLMSKRTRHRGLRHRGKRIVFATGGQAGSRPAPRS